MDEFESFLTVPKMKQTTTLMSHMKKLCLNDDDDDRIDTTEYAIRLRMFNWICKTTDYLDRSEWVTIDHMSMSLLIFLLLHAFLR